MRQLLTVLSLILFMLSSESQQICVSDFEHISRPIWKRTPVKVDEDNALLDFITEKKGFEFKTAGGEKIKVKDGDGMLTLTVPHKTKYLRIQHPDYAEYVWRVPSGGLRKRNRYRASLHATDLSKGYVNPRQWAVFSISPENAIVTIDSATMSVRNGLLERYLPTGPHTYRIESPFHETEEGRFVLTDSTREEINIRLEPFYSFLTVKLTDTHGEIFIDSKYAGNGIATSPRITGGMHRIDIRTDDGWILDSMVNVDRAEKRVIELSSQQFRRITPEYSRPSRPRANQTVKAVVHLTAGNEDTEIRLDREAVGNGEWRGELRAGFHLASTMKNGVESVPEHIIIEDSLPQEINLAVPGSSLGMINVHSNVAGAEIIIREKSAGFTPAIIKGLSAGEPHRVKLRKDGYKEASALVRPAGNDMTELYIELKKEK